MGVKTQIKSNKAISPTLGHWAAGLAFASELIHLWMLPGAFVARPLTGTFVLLAAVCQGLLGAGLLFGPGRWTVRFGLLLNATIVLAWAATRFAGFPALFGFAQLPVEPVGFVATIIEIALLVLLFKKKIGGGLKTERKKRRVLLREPSIRETEKKGLAK